MVDPRTVPTFRRRAGRLGPQLRRTLDQDVPRYELGDGAWHLGRIFPDVSSVVLEVGSGMGEGTIAMAQAEPDVGIIAVDVHIVGIASTVRAAQEKGLPNVRVHQGDALVALERSVASAALAGVRIWFPDPWPKNKHHKRRLVRREVIAAIVDRIEIGGTIHLATDVAAYADVMADVLAAEPALEPVVVAGPRPGWRPWTKYELAGLAAGRTSHDFIFRRIC